MAIAIASALLVPAAAQDAAVSPVAGVPLPVAPPGLADTDIVSVGQSALASEAEILGTQCGESEVHAWRPEDGTAVNEIVGQTNEAFDAAGWSLAERSSTSERSVYAGARDDAGMIAVWQDDGTTLLLGLCKVAASAIPGAAAQTGGDDAAGTTGEAEEEMDPAVVSAIIAAVGLALILWRVSRRRRRAAIAAWPQTEGRIVHTDVEEVDVSTADDNAADYRYDPKVRYRYEVQGAAFEGASIGMDEPRFDTPEAAENYLREKFPVSRVVPVFFNPARPKDAVLERPAERRGRVWSILHWTIVVIGAALLLFGLMGVAGSLMG